MPPCLLSKHYWFRPVCASSPAVASVRSWSSVGWVEPWGLAREVGYWNGGARVGRKYSNSGRPPTLARRSGRVDSQCDPSDGQVSSVVDFAIPLLCRGAEAFIVSAIGHSYVISLISLLLTIPSYLSTTPVVLAVRRAPADRGRAAAKLPKSNTLSSSSPANAIRPITMSPPFVSLSIANLTAFAAPKSSLFPGARPLPPFLPSRLQTPAALLGIRRQRCGRGALVPPSAAASAFSAAAEDEEWLKKLPDKKKPLYSHSLPCMEAWLRNQGFRQSRDDRAVWVVEKPNWHAQLSLDVTDLYIRSVLSVNFSIYVLVVVLARLMFLDT
ncbi:hypothetical protein BHE74_00045385 [Ensete ventricosum]|nr:hypothetical protein BHE74_00045385 [Ensete ventricosum]